MSSRFDQTDKTQLFTVVGAPYVAEQHSDAPSHYQPEKDRPPPDSGVAGLWAVFYVVIAAASLIGSGTFGRAVDYAVAMLK